MAGAFVFAPITLLALVVNGSAAVVGTDLIVKTNPVPFIESAPGFIHVFGEVTNSSQATQGARSIQVTCNLTLSGSTIATDTIPIKADILKPGESGPFDDTFVPTASKPDGANCTTSGGPTSNVADHNFTSAITSATVDPNTLQQDVKGTVTNLNNVTDQQVNVILTFRDSANNYVVDAGSVLVNGGGPLPGVNSNNISNSAAFDLIRYPDQASWSWTGSNVAILVEAPSPSVQVPSVLAFGGQVQSTQSPPQSVALTNVGTGDLHFPANALTLTTAQGATNPASDFAIASDACSGTTVAPNATCDVNLSFLPGQVGSESDALAIADDANGTPHGVVLTGTGLAEAQLMVSPQIVAFGDQTLATSVSQTVTVSNSGIGRLHIGASDLTVGAGTSSEFRIDATACLFGDLPASGTCGIVLTFSPTASGNVGGSLTIAGHDATSSTPARSSPQTITFSGNGVAVPPTPTPSGPVPGAMFDHSALGFGTQLVGTRSSSQTVTLAPISTAQLVLDAISINGQFTQTNTCGTLPAVVPQAGCTFSIGFGPQSSGPQTGTLSIVDNAQGTPPSVTLAGTGVVSTAAQSLGGMLSSGPDASVWQATGRIDLFARCLDGSLCHKTFDGSTWGSWDYLGGQLTSDPSAVSWGTNRIDVFVRGSNLHLWHNYYDGSNWGGWQDLGGILASGPEATSWAPRRLDVFARCTDRTLCHIYFDGSAWSGWQSLGGQLTSDPSAVAWTSGRLDVFARGPDQGLWHLYFDSGSWGGWQDLGGVLGSGPSAVSNSARHLDVFILCADGELCRKGFDGSSWTAWQMLGDQWISDPGSTLAGPGRIAVFLRGTDTAIWREDVAAT